MRERRRRHRHHRLGPSGTGAAALVRERRLEENRSFEKNRTVTRRGVEALVPAARSRGFSQRNKSGSIVVKACICQRTRQIYLSC